MELLKKRILAINPGSTSTKIAVYDGHKVLFIKKINHTIEEIAKYDRIFDQYDFRKDVIIKELAEAGIDLNSFDAVVGRGGLIKPMEGGVYIVNEKMILDLQHPIGEHVSNLGGVIAYEIAKSSDKNCPAFIADPTCVDEMDEIARISGIPELPRRSFLHTLNQKAVARRYAKENGLKYTELNLIVAHMGGGISVGAHLKGRIIDTNNGLNGDGPLSTERAGSVPVGQLVDLCFSGKYSQKEIHKKICGQGGLVAYLGTNSTLEVEKMIENGDKNAAIVYEAMAYQVAKEIGGLSTVLKGEVDAILLTGGVAYGESFVNMICDRIKHLGKIAIYPGEDEMQSLSMNGLLVLEGEIEAKEYE
jgi:butyrate kinase